MTVTGGSDCMTPTLMLNLAFITEWVCDLEVLENSMSLFPYLIYVRVCVLTPIWLFCDSINCNLPGSSVRGISQARIVEWIAFPSPKDLPNPGSTYISCIGRHILYHLGSPYLIYKFTYSCLLGFLQRLNKIAYLIFIQFPINYYYCKYNTIY